jgi:flagellar hook-length control protein FliK
VRMTVVSDDTTITVNIIAERSDTLDLMRRHIDQLGQTFRSLGYDQINFEFGQGHEGQEQTGEGTQDTQSDAESHANLGETQQPIEETINIHINSAPGNGVDIRL